MGNSNQEHMDNENHTNSFFAGLLIGSLAGAGIAFLLAPQSGEKTRAQIQNKGIELRDQAAKSIESAEDAVEGAVGQARIKAGRITADVRQKAEELQKQGQEMIDGIKERSNILIKAG